MLTIDLDPICEGDGTFGKGINLSIFYCFCFVEVISVKIAEKQETTHGHCIKVQISEGPWV